MNKKHLLPLSDSKFEDFLVSLIINTKIIDLSN